MKRNEITTTPEDYITALRKCLDLLVIENGNQLDLKLMSVETANRQWAAAYDLHQLMQLAKRAGVGVPELTEWLGDASAIRRGFAAAEDKQQKMFNK